MNEFIPVDENGDPTVVTERDVAPELAAQAECDHAETFVAEGQVFPNGALPLYKVCEGCGWTSSEPVGWDSVL